MFEEHDQIVLTADLTGDGGEELKTGDAGVIVHIHPGGRALVAEFTSLGGDTIALATVLPSQARPTTGADMAHARTVETPVGDVLRDIRERKAASGRRVPASSILKARDADRK